jgi:hypothetical protein
MLLGMEIGLTLYGLYALIKGKFSMGKRGEVTGTQARIAGGIFLLTIPIIFFFGLLMGVLVELGVLPFISQGWYALIDVGGILFTGILGYMVANQALKAQE